MRGYRNDVRGESSISDACGTGLIKPQEWPKDRGEDSVRYGKVLDCMIRRSFSLAHAGLLSVALLFAISSFAVPGLAETAAHGTIAMHLLRPGIAALADLDGDQIPDVASGINTGHTSAGYSYRVDFDLSSSAQPKSFSILSEEPNGLNIEAIDVDGDHDLDIVITGRLSLRPIGVWINDGSGSFTPGDLAQYVLSGWQTRRSIAAPSVHLTAAVNVEWRRLQIAFSEERVGLPPSDSSWQEVRGSLADATPDPDGSNYLRAPPIHTI